MINIISEKMWYDGVCKTCGSSVEEGRSNENFDYMNRCTNPECIHHEWHHIYDTDKEDYYIHKSFPFEGEYDETNI